MWYAKTFAASGLFLRSSSVLGQMIFQKYEEPPDPSTFNTARAQINFTNNFAHC